MKMNTEKRVFGALWILFCMTLNTFAEEADSVKVTFDFTTLTDQSGQYGGSLKNGATLTTEGGEPVLDLGSRDAKWINFKN